MSTKKYYQQNKEYVKEKSRIAAKQHTAWLLTFKNVPCHDCGKRYPPVVMDFDHVPERGPKLNSIGSIRSKEKALAEIAKCDVVCPTCHRIRTVTRAGLLTKEDLDVLSKL